MTMVSIDLSLRVGPDDGYPQLVVDPIIISVGILLSLADELIPVVVGPTELLNIIAFTPVSERSRAFRLANRALQYTGKREESKPTVANNSNGASTFWNNHPDRHIDEAVLVPHKLKAIRIGMNKLL
jgi:hypothetical protein